MSLLISKNNRQSSFGSLQTTKHHLVNNDFEIANQMADIRKGIRSQIMEKMTGFNKIFSDSGRKEDYEAMKTSKVVQKEPEQKSQTSPSAEKFFGSGQIMQQKIVPSFNILEKNIKDYSAKKSITTKSIFNQPKEPSFGQSPKKISAQTQIESIGKNYKLDRNWLQSSSQQQQQSTFQPQSQNQIGQSSLRAEIESFGNKKSERDLKESKLLLARNSEPKRQKGFSVSQQNRNSDFDSLLKGFTQTPKDVNAKKSLDSQSGGDFFKSNFLSLDLSPSKKRKIQQLQDEEQQQLQNSQQKQQLQSLITKRTMIDRLPIQKIIETKQIIESANYRDLSQLNQNYVEELTKLASAITKALKKTPYYENKF